MKHSKSYETNWGFIEGKNDRQIENCNQVKEQLQNKINEGHKINWAPNGRWCVIDGETFNIGKKLFDRLVSSGEIEYHES